MKYLVVLFVCFSISVSAQDFNLLINTAYLDNQIAFEELDNGDFISLETVLSVDTLLAINKDYAYTTLKKYDSGANLISSFSFNFIDSSKYFAEFLSLLDDGRFLVGGAKQNSTTASSGHFLKIISSDLLNQEVDIPIINNSNMRFINCFQKQDTLLSIFTNFNENIKHIIKYDLNGNYLGIKVLNTNYSNPTGSDYVSSFYFRDKIYLPYSQTDIFSAIDTSFILKIDPDETLDTISIIDSLATLSRMIHFDRKGSVYNTDNYLISSRIKKPNINSTYLGIFNFSASGNISLFYSDTSYALSAGDQSHNIKIGTKTPNNIYVILSDYFSQGTKVICNIDAQGVLKWKKSINTDNLNFQYPFFYDLTTTCATKDGGFILTFQADDEYNNHGVYYYKVDSLGNQVNLETGIFSLAPKLELNDFLLYPNPVQEKLHIETALDGNYKLKIFNALGEIVFSNAIVNNSLVDVNHLKKENYFYTITNEKNIQIQKGKFLKE